MAYEKTTIPHYFFLSRKAFFKKGTEFFEECAVALSYLKMFSRNGPPRVQKVVPECVQYRCDFMLSENNGPNNPSCIDSTPHPNRNVR